MSNLSSNLLGLCPLGKKNCPYEDSYCSDCIKQERQNRKEAKNDTRRD